MIWLYPTGSVPLENPNYYTNFSPSPLDPLSTPQLYNHPFIREPPFAHTHSPLLRRNPHGVSYVQKTGRDVCLLPPAEEPGRGEGTPKHHRTGPAPCPPPAFLLLADPGARSCQALTLSLDTMRDTDIPQCPHTLRMKSGGVPGLTVGLRTPSW